MVRPEESGCDLSEAVITEEKWKMRICNMGNGTICRMAAGLLLFFCMASPVTAFAGNGEQKKIQMEVVQEEDGWMDEALEEVGEVTEPITKEDKPYLSLGANLSHGQKDTVLKLLGVNPGELEDYDVIYTTIDEEYQYLGNYLPAEKMGQKSLSSVLVVKREQGHGISITTKNISYCTIGMYKNALITAGISDADIIVAAPFPISGTGALVGVLKAYSGMTGEAFSEESMDTALNELVLTGDLAETLEDTQQAEELIAYLKQQILEQDLDSPEEIREAVKQAGKEFGLSLTAEDVEKVTELMEKIGRLDLDAEDLVSQAKDLYDRLSDIGSSEGFFDRLLDFFRSILDYIKGLFS